MVMTMKHDLLLVDDNRKTHLVWKEGLNTIFYISLGIS